MSWLQIELQATPATLPDIEEALMGCGAVSLTLVSDADEPVLEPAPGETPLWSSVRVQALFDLQTDMSVVRRTLETLAVPVDSLQVDFVAARDWQNAVRTHAVEQVFGERLWLRPKDEDAASCGAVQSTGDLVELRLDPGLAFGSGSHPTTRMCLEWLAQNIAPGQRVLDFGCGSGILGIAAALLGARVVAVDYDPQAVMATRENATYNGLGETDMQVLSLDEWQGDEHVACFDVVVANILAAPLKSLAAEFERAGVPAGNIVLSGVLEEQAADVMESYMKTDFQSPQLEAGWACLQGDIR